MKLWNQYDPRYQQWLNREHARQGGIARLAGEIEILSSVPNPDGTAIQQRQKRKAELEAMVILP